MCSTAEAEIVDAEFDGSEANGGEVDGAFPREAEHDAPILLLNPIAGFDRPIEDEAAMPRMVANAYADALLCGRRQRGREKQKQQDEAAGHLRSRREGGRYPLG